MHFNNYIIIRDCDGLHCYGYKDSEINRLFRNASQIICFADCSEMVIDQIVVNNTPVEYVGWQPNMLFEYCNIETGEIVWSNSYLNWEH